MLFLPRRNWAAFDTQNGFLLDALENAVGAKNSTELFAQFTAAVKDARRDTVRLRPDLSNLPPSSQKYVK